MSRFIFGGVSSDEMGLIVTEPIIRPSWDLEKSEVKRPGASSNLILTGRNFANASMVIQTAIAQADTNTVRQIYSTLRGLDKLQLSTAPQEYLLAMPEPLVPEAVALAMGKLPVNFTLLPFARAVAPTVVTLTASGQYTQIDNAGTVYSEPEISFISAGEDIRIFTNGEEFRMEFPSGLTDVLITLNCEAEVAYCTQSGVKTALTQYTYGDFPQLHTGENFMRYTGSTASISVNVKERWY